MKVTLESDFSAAHLYKVQEWTPEQNAQKFGLCYSEHGHGHNYKLKATFDFNNHPLDINKINDLKKILKNLCQPLEHKHLNFDVDYFKDKNPTTEMIALYFKDQILTALKTHNEQIKKTNQINSPKIVVKKISVYESPDIWSELVL